MSIGSREKTGGRVESEVEFRVAISRELREILVGVTCIWVV